MERAVIPKNNESFLGEPEEENSINASCFRLSPNEDIALKVRTFLVQNIRCLERTDVQMIQPTVDLKAAFMVDYSINSDFSTSVGLVHSIHKTSHVLLDEAGEFVGDTINNALYSLNDMLVNANEIDASIRVTSRGFFKKTNTEIRDLAKQQLINRFTETVGYYGRNNVHYYKTCTPKPKEVQVLKVKKSYIPIWLIIFSIHRNKYSFAAIENPSGITLLPQYQQENSKAVKAYPNSCMICGGVFTEEGKFACKECGKICCPKDTFKCKICEKRVCREHTVFKRKFVILTDKYCNKCFGSLSQNHR